MSFDLFTSMEASKLNQLTSEVLHSQLVLFVNYEPNSLPALDSSGKFLQGALNLYKLFQDTTRIPSKLYFLLRDYCYCGNDSLLKESSFAQPLGELQTGLEEVGVLRTMLAHNESEKNGLWEQQLLRKRKEWMMKHLNGRSEPENAKDYDKLVNQLETLGERCREALKKILQLCKSSNLTEIQRTALVEAWKQEMLSRYEKRTGKTDIILSQICALYFAQRTDSSPRIDKQCVYAYTVVFLYQKALQKYIVMKTVPGHAAMIHSKILEDIGMIRTELEQFKAQLPEDVSSWQETLYQCFRAKYCSVKAMQNYLNENPKCTIEPQSFLQKYLDGLFRPVFQYDVREVNHFIHAYEEELAVQ